MVIKGCLLQLLLMKTIQGFPVPKAVSNSTFDAFIENIEADLDYATKGRVVTEKMIPHLTKSASHFIENVVMNFTNIDISLEVETALQDLISKYLIESKLVCEGYLPVLDPTVFRKVTKNLLINVVYEEPDIKECILQNTRLSGTDMKNSQIRETFKESAEECQEECSSEEECQFFLFFTVDHYQSWKHGRCRLLRMAGMQQRNQQGHSSGPKFCQQIKTFEQVIYSFLEETVIDTLAFECNRSAKFQSEFPWLQSKIKDIIGSEGKGESEEKIRKEISNFNTVVVGKASESSVIESNSKLEGIISNFMQYMFSETKTVLNDSLNTALILQNDSSASNVDKNENITRLEYSKLNITKTEDINTSKVDNSTQPNFKPSPRSKPGSDFGSEQALTPEMGVEIEIEYKHLVKSEYEPVQKIDTKLLNDMKFYQWNDLETQVESKSNDKAKNKTEQKRNFGNRPETGPSADQETRPLNKQETKSINEQKDEPMIEPVYETEPVLVAVVKPVNETGAGEPIHKQETRPLSEPEIELRSVPPNKLHTEPFVAPEFKLEPALEAAVELDSESVYKQTTKSIDIQEKQPLAEPVTEPKSEPVDEQKTGPESKPIADPEYEVGPVVEAAVEIDSKADYGTETEALRGQKNKTNNNPETWPLAEPETEPESEPVNEHKTNPLNEPEFEPMAEEPEYEPEPILESVVELDSDHLIETETEPKEEQLNKPETGPMAKLDIVAPSGLLNAQETDLLAEPESKPKSVLGVKTEAEPNFTAGSEYELEPVFVVAVELNSLPVHETTTKNARKQKPKSDNLETRSLAEPELQTANKSDIMPMKPEYDSKLTSHALDELDLEPVNEKEETSSKVPINNEVTAFATNNLFSPITASTITAATPASLSISSTASSKGKNSLWQQFYG